MRRTKIVCTMGPNENDYEVMKALAETMDVARFNFSHGDHEEHLSRLEKLRKLRKELGRPIAALLDTKGPEIRTGLLKDGQKITLREGEKIVLTTEEVVGTKEKIYINYDKLHEDVKPGNVILIDDGLIGLEVEAVNGVEIQCKVTNGGELGEKKGVNVPGVPIQLPSITDKDIDEIIEASDGIMLARGDLGVEIDAKRIPQLQKEIIQKCNYHGKLVITATQMLDSMIRNPRPTRAEVTDVANAVYDGTDAVMLSGESANGKYPVEAARTMASIVEYTEQFLNYKQFKTRMVEKTMYESIGNAMCAASVTTASELKATAIVASTLSGITASMISKYRPITPIYALSPSQTVTRQMMLFWGVTPIWARRAETTDELFESSVEELKERKLLKSGDLCVITAGVLSRLQKQQAPTGTNIMRVIKVD